MNTWIRLPEGKFISESCLILVSNKPKELSGVLRVYFSEAGDPILIDALDCLQPDLLEFEQISPLQGIRLLLMCKGESGEKITAAYLQSASKEETAGFIQEGLLTDSWQIRFPGPLPSSGFRIQIQFS